MLSRAADRSCVRNPAPIPVTGQQMTLMCDASEIVSQSCCGNPSLRHSMNENPGPSFYAQSSSAVLPGIDWTGSTVLSTLLRRWPTKMSMMTNDDENGDGRKRSPLFQQRNATTIVTVIIFMTQQPIIITTITIAFTSITFITAIIIFTATARLLGICVCCSSSSLLRAIPLRPWQNISHLLVEQQLRPYIVSGRPKSPQWGKRRGHAFSLQSLRAVSCAVLRPGTQR